MNRREAANKSGCNKKVGDSRQYKKLADAKAPALYRDPKGDNNWLKPVIITNGVSTQCPSSQKEMQWLRGF